MLFYDWGRALAEIRRYLAEESVGILIAAWYPGPCLGLDTSAADGGGACSFPSRQGLRAFIPHAAPRRKEDSP